MFILSIEACYQNSTVALYNNLKVIGIFMGLECELQMKEMKGKATCYNLVPFLCFSSIYSVKKGFQGFPPTTINDNMFTMTF